MRTVVALLAAILMTAVFAYAHAAVPAGLSAPDPSTAKTLEAQIAQRAASLVAPEVQIRSVKLGCAVAAGTRLKTVAPGITRLNARVFMVELELDHRPRLCGASLDAQRQVMVATHALGAGQPVTAQDFAPGWVDAFTGAPGAASSFDFSSAMVTTTSIGAGQPLYPTQLAKPAAVHPGDMVSVVVKNGAITVKTELESRSSASIGDSATMLNPETGTTVQVHVTGVRTAEMVIQ
jgi:flagella basal body P-ring formation protein FlgA